METFIFNFKNLIALIILFGVAACNFAPGSYPYAEKYEMKVSEPILIEAIQTFKMENPQYKVPEQTQLTDGRSDIKDHWYNVYFYYPEENQIIFTWTRPSDKGYTTLAFISVNIGLTIGNWKEINKDFDDSENEEQKQKFEERILSKIKEKVK